MPGPVVVGGMFGAPPKAPPNGLPPGCDVGVLPSELVCCPGVVPICCTGVPAPVVVAPAPVLVRPGPVIVAPRVYYAYPAGRHVRYHHYR